MKGRLLCSLLKFLSNVSSLVRKLVSYKEITFEMDKLCSAVKMYVLIYSEHTLYH